MSDATIEFTAQWLKELEAVPGQQLEFFDTKLENGFGVRVGTRTKTFFMSYREGGRKYRATLGYFGSAPANAQYPVLTLKEARQSAKEIDTNKLNPAKQRQVESEIGNFAGLVAKFKAAYKDYVRPTTWGEYERQLDTLVDGERDRDGNLKLDLKQAH